MALGGMGCRDGRGCGRGMGKMGKGGGGGIMIMGNEGRRDWVGDNQRGG